MSFTHYMVMVTSGTMTTNKLQTAIRKELMQMDRKIVSPEELPALKRQIETKVKKHNSSFNNCTPIFAKFYDLDYQVKNGIYPLSLDGYTFVHLKI